MQERTTEVFIPTVIERARCKHSPLKGEPCYEVPSFVDGHILSGVCNARAKKAGFKAQINPKSMRQTSKG